MVQYISQRNSLYADCVPIAICNALRFLGRSTPRPGTQTWEKVVDVAGCRYGGTISERGVAAFLGAKLIRVARKSISTHLPVMLTVHNPEVGHAFHAVTVIEADAEKCTVINYRVESGPLVECVPWGKKPPLDRKHPWEAIHPRGAVYKVVGL